MPVKMNSFHVTDVIYDADLQKLTFKFISNDIEIERVGIGFTSDQDIVDSFHETIVRHFAKS